MQVQTIVVSVWVVEFHLLGKSCSLGLPYVRHVICLFEGSVIFDFGFKGRILVLIAYFPVIAYLLLFL